MRTSPARPAIPPINESREEPLRLGLNGVIGPILFLLPGLIIV